PGLELRRAELLDVEHQRAHAPQHGRRDVLERSDSRARLLEIDGELAAAPALSETCQEAHAPWVGRSLILVSGAPVAMCTVRVGNAIALPWRSIAAMKSSRTSWRITWNSDQSVVWNHAWISTSSDDAASSLNRTTM